MNIYDLAINRIEEFGGELDQLELSPITGQEGALLYIVVDLLTRWGVIRTQTWLMSVYLTYLNDNAYWQEHEIYMALIPSEDDNWLL
jgi:hypothetical protein